MKKYVRANNSISVTDNQFDALLNKAIRVGVEKGVFSQPKGSSGGTKLAKKEVKPKAEKKAAPKKAAAPKVCLLLRVFTHLMFGRNPLLRRRQPPPKSPLRRRQPLPSLLLRRLRLSPRPRRRLLSRKLRLRRLPLLRL